MTIGLITLISTVIISLLITRIGSVALTMTGMATETARFQARSAYTGVGFTTTESEQIVNHPVRRRVVAFLMLTGNVGIAVVIASMMAAFAEGADTQTPLNGWMRILILMGVLLALWILGTRRWVDQTIEKLIEWALRRWTDLDVYDYVSLLHLGNGYVVFEIRVEEDDWVSGKSLADARLTSEGVLVLGIHRGEDQYIGSPSGKNRIRGGDLLTVYGARDHLEELGLRKHGFSGDRAHRMAIQKQRQVSQADSEKD